MRAVGEALGLGRTFPEALLKALEGVEAGAALPEIPGLHPYFAGELASIGAAERRAARDRRRRRGEALRAPGLPHRRAARRRRRRTSAAGAASPAGSRSTPAPASSRRGRPTTTSRTSRATATRRRPGAIVVLGSGTNRIGQGIEFDYCCVHAAQAFRRLGYEAVLVNSNPETVSTDYDTCDRLYLEPVTLERVLDVVRARAAARRRRLARRPDAARPRRRPRRRRACRCSATRSPRSTLAEDRGRFGALLAELGLRAPAWGVRRDDGGGARGRRARSATRCSSGPSYVLGGRGMRVARGPEELELDGPALVDRFLEGALELDVDVLCDGEDAWVAAIARARRARGRPLGRLGVRPPGAVGRRAARGARSGSSRRRSSRGLGARGLLNLQLALHDGDLYVLEANPRASRTVPFVAKATGDPARRPRLPAAARRSRSPSSTCPSGRCRRAPGRRRRSSRPSASRARPTAAPRCARPAR